MQKGKPVAYASRSLVGAKPKSSQTEKEIRAVFLVQSTSTNMSDINSQ